MYYSEAIKIGYFIEEPHKIVVITPGQHLLANFIIIEENCFEEKFKRPQTMLDLAILIENYIYKLNKYIENIKTKHAEYMTKLKQPNIFNNDNNLPF